MKQILNQTTIFRFQAGHFAEDFEETIYQPRPVRVAKTARAVLVGVVIA